MIKPGTEIAETHPLFKHWKSKGYLTEVNADTTKANPVPPVESEKPAEISAPEDSVDKPDIEIADLEFVTPEMADALQEAGVISTADLDDWTKDELVKIPGIGAKTAEKLLASRV